MKYYIFLRTKKFRDEDQVSIHKQALLKTDSPDLFKIGKNSSIGAFTVVYVFNVDEGRNNSSLQIGEGTYIGEHNNIRACGGRVTIGNSCLISQFVSIIASNHSIEKGQFIMNQKSSETDNFVIIEDDVWIGANATILPGAIIRKGAVIAAGSVVKGEIPDHSIVAGAPATLIRYRT